MGTQEIEAERVPLSRHPFLFSWARELPAGHSKEPAVLIELYAIGAAVPVIVEPDLRNAAGLIEKGRALGHTVAVTVDIPNVANTAGKPLVCR